ncbi:MAG: YeeE/YedE thiosulfate transporter family protein, partial [Anaerolineales bacterium]
MLTVWNYMRKEEWSPYIAGGLLGLVGVLAVALTNNLLGASGAFENVAGLIGQAAAPKLFNNLYFNFIMPPGLTWQVILVVGIFFGGMLGAKLAGTWKWRAMPDQQWTSIFGRSRVTRWAVVFFGAIVLEIGAGIAGGCTSGLAIAGGMLLAPAAYLFIAAMFT